MATSAPTVVTTGTREEMLANAQKIAQGIKTSLADPSTKLSTKQSAGISSGITKASTELSKVPTVTASSLQGAKGTVGITQPTPGTQTAGMLGEIQSNTDAYTQNLINQSNTQKAGFDSATSAYQDFLKNLQGTTGLTTDAYAKKGGVDDIQVELNDINQQIRAEQNSLINKVNELEKNKNGMFAGALQDTIEDTNRESLRKQADLSIIQMGVQGRYDSAKQIADRAVSAYLEKQSILNDTLKFNYENAKSLFDKAEQRAFESAQADRERKLNEDRDNMLGIRQLAIQAQQNGAPTSMVQSILNSKTLDEAIGKNTWVKPVAFSSTSSNQMTDNERALMSQFRGEQIVKDYNDILSQKGTMDAFIANGVGGPADLAMVFSFMKGLDPTSVVRESEYDTAAKSGNIFQGAFAKFNGYFKEKGGFLPPNVKQEFQNLVNQKLAVKDAQYQNVVKSYTGIAERQGLNPENVVIDYASGGYTVPEIPKEEQETKVFDAVTVEEPKNVFVRAWNWLTQ